MKYYEISPLISSRIAVFPGDVAFTQHQSMQFEKGDHLRLSSFNTTCHLGAHADSTGHYHPEGLGVSEQNLIPYAGKCQVIHVSNCHGQRLQMTHIKGKKIEAKRILFRTDTYTNPEVWRPDFASLSPELIHHLASAGVVLVGLDTPSVDPQDSKALESHQALYATTMSVLEGLDLSSVPEGIFTLIALPLRIENADASPVRAILLESLGEIDN